MKFLSILLLIPCAAFAQMIEVPSAGGAPTKTLLASAPDAKATVLLLPGGPGMLNLQPDGSTANPHTFVRSIGLWRQYGINAVLFDSAEDLGNTKSHGRLSREHQRRLGEVAAYYKEKLGVPLWLFGHSMGTTSVTGYANAHKGAPGPVDGLIVAGTNNTAGLDRDVALPTLAIHHVNDGCRFDPVGNSESIVRSRAPAVRTKLVLLQGGPGGGDPCGAQSFHGFIGVEADLVRAAADFILAK